MSVEAAWKQYSYAGEDLAEVRKAFEAGYASASRAWLKDTATAMYDEARANFRTAAAGIILGDAELQAKAVALEAAIGEVSVDQALDGLARYKAERQLKAAAPKVCPRCGSPEPRLHPAVQLEGEVQRCADPFHGQQ